MTDADPPPEAGPQGRSPRPEGASPAPEGCGKLSHVEVDASGREHAVMVDVSGKAPGARSALARAELEFPAGVLDAVLAGEGPKGPVEEVARVAGILAAKRTGDLVPMCHPLALDGVAIDFRRVGPDRLEVRCSVRCQGRTGVEMEAMVGASLAALTVYDMTKALSKGIRVGAVELLEKTGGKSGTWRRTDPS